LPSFANVDVLPSFGKIIEYYEVLPLLCEVLPRFAKIIEYYQVLSKLSNCVRFCQSCLVVLSFVKGCQILLKNIILSKLVKLNLNHLTILKFTQFIFF
jgi:hypothetical protein